MRHRKQMILQTILVFVFSVFSFSSLQAEETLRVGVNLPLTGVAAEYGTAVRNGIQLAREEHQKSFHGIEFIFEDNAYDARQALSIHHKFKSIDKCHLEFVWGEVGVASIAPVAESETFPVIGIATDPRQLKNYKYTLRFLNTQREYAEKLVLYLRKRGLKRIGIILADDPYYDAYVYFIRDLLIEGESIEIISSHLPSDNDFKSTILKAKANSYDAVGLFIFLGQISTFYRQAKLFDYQPVIFGADDFESKSEIAASGGGMNGAVFVHNQTDDSFVSRYHKRFMVDSHMTYAANAYDFANALTLLYEKLGKGRDGKKILYEFSRLDLPSGATGKPEFQQSQADGQYFQFPLLVKKIVDGQVVSQRE